jgi:Nucleotidyl transferase AbiEii toxin, Type IV TA system
MAELNQAPDGGARFPVDARLDGRTFVKFHLDLGVGDEVLEPLESIEGETGFGFAGIPAVVVPALSVEQHWAEKFHAYTRPRETPNIRVRDLVDLVLILEHEAPATERVRTAVDATFQRAECIQCLTLCRSRRQGGRSRLRLSPPSVGWSTHLQRRTKALRPSGAAYVRADKVLASRN